MIKKDITFENFDGERVTESHYFHISKKEIIDLETAEGVSLSAKLQAVGGSNDGGEIMKTFNWIIGLAYGQRDANNAAKFFKSEQITEEFMNSLAYDALFTELLLNPANAAAFVNGIFPSDLQSFAENIETAALMNGDPEEKTKENQASGLEHPRTSEGVLVPWAFRYPTNSEQTQMSREQMVDVMKRQAKGWEPPTSR